MGSILRTIKQCVLSIVMLILQWSDNSAWNTRHEEKINIVSSSLYWIHQWERFYFEWRFRLQRIVNADMSQMKLPLGLQVLEMTINVKGKRRKPGMTWKITSWVLVIPIQRWTDVYSGKQGLPPKTSSFGSVQQRQMPHVKTILKAKPGKDAVEQQS